MSRTSMDMTRGSLKKQILFFSIPLMLSNLLQVLFNMSDIAVIGQFAGAMSLGAVGSTTTLISMYTGFLIGLSGGINVLTALYIGARNRKSVSETVHSAFLVSLVVGLILLILGVYIARCAGAFKYEGGADRQGRSVHPDLFPGDSGACAL